ncbi:MAG: hypothetical protein WB524_23365 [Acidobacteriaceae bacterium]|jgi:hypothetical protein
MKSILRALALTGMIGLGAAGAQAQTRVFVGVRAPIVAAVPPCPGVDYVWTPGYYSGAVWFPGRWNYRGYAYGVYGRDHVVARDFHRDFRYDRDLRGRR